ncbi:uncharacterized protein LOC121983800 [Zingiber officinale]|uniref:DUF7356 domain-containing protein n=1 Tax=Zingiber officinale TaxID=94328 RepID=A0A8J5GL73_ZINOF|nr:uncharacterized protein LOC121983800 [Zingiber officinale]KAG6502457.1 hypothetical protein ZIOFF_034730 [Zingiber officinale]
MGRFRSLSAILSLYFLLLASVASSRVLMSDSKDTPSSTPTPVSPRPAEIPPPNPNSTLGVKELSETCDSSHVRCHGTVTVCILYSEKDSKNYSLVVQNIGDDTSNVKIIGKPAFPVTIANITLAKNISKKIALPFDASNVMEIFIYSGSDNCSIQIGAPDSDWNILQQLLSTYDIHLTPIYGLYLLGFTVVVSGATWACCLYRKRRNTDSSGIPYQQIEMSDQPQSTVMIDSNAVDGWDDWDDNWDDEAATRPAEKHTSTSVSSNGLTSRTPKKDGWDSAWDD